MRASQKCSGVSENKGACTAEQKAALRAAKNAAVRLLAGRDHTPRELARKLKTRGFDASTAERAIEACIQLQCLNEGAFARAYRKQMTLKGYGVRFIRMAMKQKGFKDRHIDAAFAEYDLTVDEMKAAQCALTRKCNALRYLPDNLKKKEKLFRFLISRGFSRETAYEALLLLAPDA